MTNNCSNAWIWFWVNFLFFSSYLSHLYYQLGSLNYLSNVSHLFHTTFWSFSETKMDPLLMTISSGTPNLVIKFFTINLQRVLTLISLNASASAHWVKYFCCGNNKCLLVGTSNGISKRSHHIKIIHWEGPRSSKDMEFRSMRLDNGLTQKISTIFLYRRPIITHSNIFLSKHLGILSWPPQILPRAFSKIVWISRPSKHRRRMPEKDFLYNTNLTAVYRIGIL